MKKTTKKEQLEQELDELQRLKSCADKGFAIQDYISCKEATIEMLNLMIERDES